MHIIVIFTLGILVMVPNELLLKRLVLTVLVVHVPFAVLNGRWTPWCFVMRILYRYEDPVSLWGSCFVMMILYRYEDPLSLWGSCFVMRILYRYEDPVSLWGSCFVMTILYRYEDPLSLWGSCFVMRILYRYEDPVIFMRILFRYDASVSLWGSSIVMGILYRYEDPTSHPARYFITKCIGMPPEKLTVSQLVKKPCILLSSNIRQYFLNIIQYNIKQCLLNIKQSLFLSHSILPTRRTTIPTCNKLLIKTVYSLACWQQPAICPPEPSKSYAFPFCFFKSFLILSWHLRLGLPSGPFSLGFPT